MNPLDVVRCIVCALGTASFGFAIMSDAFWVTAAAGSLGVICALTLLTLEISS